MLTFRGKLNVIVGIATISLAAVVSASALSARRVEARLETIQRRYVPKVELQPQLESAFERLQRGFQDAVAIRDGEGLSATRELRARFLERLDAAGEAVDRNQATALRESLEAYYEAADDVSRRLIAGETGEGLVSVVADMQRKQAGAGELIKVVAALNRHELEGAFSSAARAATSAELYGLVIGLTCMIVAVALSARLSRGVVKTVTEVTNGFRRFGTGDFTRKIAIATGDELELVARHANEMAENLERLEGARAKAVQALAIANRELETFSYSVAHDLRAPLRGINGFSRALQDDFADKLDTEAKGYLQRIATAAQRMGELIDSLLALARVTRVDLRREAVDLTRLAGVVVKQLRTLQPERTVAFTSEEEVVAHADRPLLQAVLENLIGNAWKFTGTRSDAEVTFGTEQVDGERAYFVRDNGAGFDMAFAEKLFVPFQRLHKASEFAGTGVGLATVQRIIHRHGGRIWAKSTVGHGATFYFTLPEPIKGVSR
jgi:signal transduction histidine kinase